MKFNRLALLGAMAALSGLSVGAADITINDLNASSGFSGGPFGAALEDNEVESGAIANQGWDYEAFIQNGNSIGIVAGFDMKSGAVAPNYVTPQGDIFIRLGSRVDPHTVGSGADPVAFDYVIHFPQVPPPGSLNGAAYWTPGTDTVQYQVFSRAQIPDSEISATSSTYVINGGALLPGWLYQASPNGDTPIASGLADYEDNSAITGYQGTGRDVLSGIDLSWLGSQAGFTGQDVYLFTTMGCGNDLLMGKASVNVPDGGTTLVLLGMGLAGVAVSRRRQAKA